LNYGLHGHTHTESKWNNSITLESPALNISEFFIDPTIMRNVRWHEQTEVSLDTSNLRFIVGNEIYDRAYLEERGRCQTKEVKPYPTV
jgi:hypothetical protein